jgi:lysozyme
MLPAGAPNLTLPALRQRVGALAVDESKYPLWLVGIRGYYLNTMGKRGVNDRGIYDDAIFVVSPNVFAAFNGNVDPSARRKRMASLVPGRYLAHRFGKHRNQYRALVQRAGPVTVARDDSITETGYFGINIHRGSNTGTSSEGCQTIPPRQWDAFIGLVESEARRLYAQQWQAKTIPYILLGS